MIFLVIEHYPYTPCDGYEETVTSICSTRDKAQQLADEYNQEYAPYFFTVRPVNIEE